MAPNGQQNGEQNRHNMPVEAEDAVGQQLNLSIKRTTATGQLRAMLAESGKIVVCPGVFDGLTARLALQNRFDCLYMTGAGTSISRIGMADLGLATMNDMCDNADMIANLDPSVPVIADADTGYGGSISVGRTVAKYIQAGVAALHLEDQVVNKRCGHLAGKELVSQDEFLSRIRAAVNMRHQLNSDIVIIARTDALQPLGFGAAIERLKAAITVGADVVFLEAIQTREQAEEVCRIFGHKTPVMYGMVQGSSAPKLTVDEARQIGFKIIVYAGLCLTPIYISVNKAMEVLQSTGDVEKYDDGPSGHQLFATCGLRELMAFDQAAKGKGEQ